MKEKDFSEPKLESFLDEKIKQLKLVLDVITATKPSIKDSPIPGTVYTFPIVIPYDRFLPVKSHEATNLLIELSNNHIIQNLETLRDEVSFDFSLSITNNRKLLDNLKEKVTKRYDEILNNEKLKNIRPLDKISLSGKNITFNDGSSTIFVGKSSCQLPFAKNEHCFARVMITRHPVGEFVDWSDIYKEITGDEPDSIEDIKKNQKMVRDTMDRLNNRIKATFNTDDELLSWENRSIKRNY